jgi:hypothetical protein
MEEDPYVLDSLSSSNPLFNNTFSMVGEVDGTSSQESAVQILYTPIVEGGETCFGTAQGLSNQHMAVLFTTEEVCN